ncbi:50S ribosomal protein L18 [Candidatus Pacearchaeota archaeon]|nr:50S ribosomal protein L18 [Candidatus Pacearchaeota archaeon]|tara:strand:- start:311 stop:790 length:480 start_codon:yes stop_codon:yes gene_type:complete
MKKQNKLDKKRRREGRTNYTRRLILLKGRSLRFIVRKSSRYLSMQIVESENAVDKVVYGVSTKDLLKYEWPKEKVGSLKSLGAAYLGGLLLGKKMKKMESRVILDSGLIPSTKGSRVYAAVKGLSDSGIDIKFDEKMIPETERIEKESFFNDVKGGIMK